MSFAKAKINQPVRTWVLRLNVFLLNVFLHLTCSEASAASVQVTIVDVMVLYSPTARIDAGGTKAISTQIEVAFAEANLVFENSRANIRVRPVHYQELNYIESASLRTDLERLQDPDDGYLDAVHSLRDRHEADVVCLVVGAGADSSFRGLPGPSPANAFSIIRQAHLSGEYFFPVALSFNFGCQPGRLFADSDGAFPFSYGYTAQTAYSWFSSVETFGGQRLPYFSNPDLVFGDTNAANWFRLGVSEGLPGAANNSRTLNLTAPIVAGFRGGVVQTTSPQIAILSPTNRTDGVQGTNLLLTVNANDPDGAVRKVDFLYSEAANERLVLIGTATNAPFSLVWSNAPDGQFRLVAQAVDNEGATTWSAPAYVRILPRPPTSPTNDHFAAATEIVGTNAVVTGWNRLATEEPGEPNHAGFSGKRSVWWRWTAPVTGKVRSHTIGSEFNTVLAVYTGASVSNLTLVADNYDYAQSEVLFRVESGATYHIAVDGYGDAKGDVTLSLDYPPVPLNDDFADRVLLAGIPNELLGDNRYTMHEPGEPFHGWNRGRGSLWWEWTAPSQGVAEVLVSGSPLRQRFVAVYRGSSVTNLYRIGAAQDRWEPARVAFDAEAGQSFLLAVDSSNYQEPAGPFVLQMRLHEPPLNDNFSSRVALVGTHVVLTNSNMAATSEPDEPAHSGSPPANTVWWKWTAPSDGLLTLETASGHTLAAYTGTTLPDLFPVTSGTRLVFSTQSGMTYQIAADGPEGEIVFDLLFSSVRITTPANRTRFQTGAEVPITVTATGVDGLIQHVELYADGELLGSGTTLPFDFVWTNALPGEHVLSANTFSTDGLQRQAVPLTIALRPEGDDFTNSVLLSGDKAIVTVHNAGASAEPDEPEHSIWGVGGSLWWHWTAPASGRVTMNFQGSDFGPVASIYLGESLSNLVLISRSYTSWSTDWIASFDAKAGNTYRLALTTPWNTDAGRIVMDWSFAQAPPNDNFADRIPLSGPQAIAQGSNTTATAEAGESNSSGSSVWWTWTAPSSGPVSLGTAGSSFPLPQLRAYSGTSISNLVLVADGRAQLSFDALAGQAYQIAVDANGGWVGDIRLILIAGLPENDNFSNRLQLDGAHVAAVGVNRGAGHETGEPIHGQIMGSNSVWWTWTAPRPGTLNLSVTGDGFSPTWAIYSGVTLAGLSLVADSYDWAWGISSSISLAVQPGVPLQIAVDSANGNTGILFLDLDFVDLPTNDYFTNRVQLSGTALTVTGNTSGATKETGEPDHVGYPGGRSIWWSWTAPTNGRVRLDAEGSKVPTMAAVYSGDSIPSLAPVAGGNATFSPIEFDCEAGIPYQIAVDHWGADLYGPVVLNLLFSTVRLASPINDEVFHAPANVPVTVETTPWDGPLVNVDVLANGLTVASSSDSISFSWSNAPLGNHALQARVTDAEGITRISPPVNVSIRPGNDDFTNSEPILHGTDRIITQGGNATLEPGEPTHGAVSYASIWWTWIAPENGTFTLRKSEEPDRRYLLIAVYTGSNVSNLTLRTNTPSHGSGTTTHTISFIAEAGVAYHIAVAGPTETLESVRVDLQFQAFASPALADHFVPGAPQNDRFTQAVHLSGSQVSADGTTALATLEPGEPSTPGAPANGSVWYSWTAPASGDARIVLEGSEVGQPFAVYAGSSVSNLFLIATGNLEDSSSEAAFYALAGLRYHIAVCDNNGISGAFTLNLNATPPPPRLQADSFLRLPDGTCQLRVAGRNGQSFIVETSSDLMAWNILTFDTLQGSSFSFVDAFAGDAPQRFYRVRPLEALFTSGPLRLVSPTFHSEFLQLQVHGAPGLPFTLEASEDCRSWHRLTTGQIIGETFRFVDRNVAGSSQRFYRAIYWP